MNFQGGNLALYRVPNLNLEIRFLIYLYEQHDSLVVTDIDGTITQSDVRGQIYPSLGLSIDQPGVVNLYEQIGKRGYKMIYMTARSMGTDQSTREYLFRVGLTINLAIFC